MQRNNKKERQNMTDKLEAVTHTHTHTQAFL